MEKVQVRFGRLGYAFFTMKKPWFWPFDKRGSFFFSALMFFHLCMQPCDAQVLMWGHDLDNQVLTFDIGLNAIRADTNGPDKIRFENEGSKKHVGRLFP